MPRKYPPGREPSPGGHQRGIGRPPWGYVSVAGNLEPTEDARVWAPRIFQAVIDGSTVDQVAGMLNAAGVRSNASDGLWREQTLGRMIRTSTYSGLRPRAGQAPLEVPAVIPRDLQERAIAALAARAHGGADNRSGSLSEPPLLAKLKCGHPDCPGHGNWPMYRIKQTWYRCMGDRQVSKGCGAPIIRAPELDQLILNRMTHLSSLNREQQRGFLANRGIKAWKTEVGIHVTIDGKTFTG